MGERGGGVQACTLLCCSCCSVMFSSTADRRIGCNTETEIQSIKRASLACHTSCVIKPTHCHNYVSLLLLLLLLLLLFCEEHRANNVSVLTEPMARVPVVDFAAYLLLNMFALI